MKLSVIILNYNVRFFLEQCVFSVQKALVDIDSEIIIVDNNSSDDSSEMIKKLFPSCVFIENKENVGFPKGNNCAVAIAKGEYICILNPDTVVAEDTFTKILNSKLWQINTGIIGCKLIDGRGNFLPESKRGVPTPWVAFTKIFGLYKVSNFFGKYYAQDLSENQSGSVDILVGAFMVMKKSLFDEVGGFDEDCFMYSDDIDLSYMVLQKNKVNYYFHETTIIHYKGESTIRDQEYMKRFQEAMQFFYKKHFKKSIFFDYVTRFGAFIFSLSKTGQIINKNRKIDLYIVFTKKSLELNVTTKKLYLNDFSLFKNNLSLNIEIIFNTQCFTFKEIIQFMNTNKDSNLTFKNYLESSNYIIGSNNSKDRGEIIQLKN